MTVRKSLLKICFVEVYLTRKLILNEKQKRKVPTMQINPKYK